MKYAELKRRLAEEEDRGRALTQRTISAEAERDRMRATEIKKIGPAGYATVHEMRFQQKVTQQYMRLANPESFHENLTEEVARHIIKELIADGFVRQVARHRDDEDPRLEVFTFAVRVAL